jgi:hypothetical protein
MAGGRFLFLAFVLLSQQAAPPRDAAGPPAATGSVRGRITSSASGAPLHRVRVTLNGAVQNAPSAVTDTLGTFELLEVPAGSYTLTATRSGYLTVQYGQRRPREAGRTINVAAGGEVGGIDMALPRGSVLAGRITDEAGDPAPGVRVEALEYRYVRGRRLLVPARLTTTNDIGEYRLSGLEPGSFRLRASSTEAWESDDGKTTHVFAITYFPGVTGVDTPQAIDVDVGQEIGGLDFRLVAGNAAHVSGTVEDANGAPLRDQQVYLSEISRGIGGRLVSSGQGAPPVRTDARGAFEFSSLAPGEYLVGTGGAEDRVSVTVVLGEGDAQHVTLSPRRPAAFSGRVVTDDGSAPPFLPGRIRLMPVPVEARHALPLWGESSGETVRTDWTFRMVNLDGPRLFRVTGLPDQWMLAAVRIGGRDITDTPFEVTRGGPDVSGAEIVLSRKGARVEGLVTSRSGSPAQDSTVILFPENTALWGPGSRFVRAIRPDDKGRFELSGLPPGTYRVVARSLVMDGQWEDPAYLQTLAQTGVRAELSESAVETVTLTAEQER